MLAALIIWSYLTVLLYLYGASTAWLLQRWLGDRAPVGLGLPLILLIGTIAFGTGTAIFSLFISLGWLAALLLLAGGILLYLVVRPPLAWTARRPSAAGWLVLAVLLLAALIVLESATHATSNPDTNLYHAQTIRWIETFRAVPGLGNLNGRLVYNSDWLVLNAATSFAFLGLRSFHLIAGWLFLLASLYFAEGVLGVARNPALLSNWIKLLFLPLAFRILTGEISSPGTDLPVILLTWLLMALAAEAVESGWMRTAGSGASSQSEDVQPAAPRDLPSLQAMLIALLPAFIVTLKLSAAPLLLFSVWVFVLLLRAHEPRRAWIAALFAVIILLPWFARSVIQSGYLVFPFSRLDLFSFDWKIPAAYVDAVRDGVVGWARQPNKDWPDAVKMPLSVWLPAWFSQQTLSQRLMVILALLSPLGLAFPEARKHAVAVIVNYIGILFWLFSAPNLRFGYGFLLAAVAFLASAVLAFIARSAAPAQARRTSFAAAGLLLLVLAYTLVGTFDAGSVRNRLILPVDYAKFRTVSCAAGSLALSCAAAYKQCGYAAFPCVPNVPAGVLPRGSSLQDGFYSTK